MKMPRPTTLLSALTFVAVLLICKVTFSIVLGYRDYFPPIFKADFLVGREAYFFGPYEWAFYTHIVSGPITLALGLVLISERFRRRFPKWHRSLGKSQILLVALVLSPSGFWMALYARMGEVAASGFAVLSLVTAGCALLGWRSAVRRRFVEHRQWMWRCFLLLCSAIVVRVIGGFATVFAPEAMWIYPCAAWTSWLVPLVGYELYRFANRPPKKAIAMDARHFASAAPA
jgi:uncharacterized membrane protein YozB (DUF420 family)